MHLQSKELCLDHTLGTHFVNHGNEVAVSSNPSLLCSLNIFCTVINVLVSIDLASSHSTYLCP